jgi:hypothetical protein
LKLKIYHPFWLIAGLFLALPAAAQDDDERYFEDAEPVVGEIEPFEAIDYNADGFLQWQEVRNMVARLFLTADVNGDRYLDRDEFNFQDEHWEMSDKDKNSKVDLREMESHAALIFAAADTNNDEKLSPGEGEAAKKKEGLTN